MSELNMVINRLVNQVQTKPRLVRVGWNDASHAVIQRINEALHNADEEERFRLATELFRIWAERGEEATEVFGEKFLQESRGRVMFSVTGDGQQLRVWHGLCGRINPGHVDSCGQNLLLDVSGDKEIIEKYLNAFCETWPLTEVKVPNGVRLYMCWSY